MILLLLATLTTFLQLLYNMFTNCLQLLLRPFYVVVAVAVAVVVVAVVVVVVVVVLSSSSSRSSSSRST